MAESTFQITGKLKLLYDTTAHGTKGFRKREFVVTTEDRYPQDLKFEATNDRCDTLDKFQAGDALTVKFDPRGNEHNGKYYVSLVAWAIMFTGADGQPKERQQGSDGGTTEQAKNALRIAAGKGMDSLKNTFLGFTPALKKELSAFKDSLKIQAEAADTRHAPQDEEDEIPLIPPSSLQARGAFRRAA